MTTTKTSTQIRTNRVAATIERDGNRLGHVVCKGRTFTASRKVGSEQDMRRMATGFRTVEAAAAWVAKAGE
jgi:hypothetical protein